MKREKSSFLILVVEIAVIIFLHSTRNRQTETGTRALANKQSAATATYQLNVLPVAKLK